MLPRAAATRIDSFSRVRLVDRPTPIQRLQRVEASIGTRLGSSRLYVKRDDLTGLGGGGSKLRKLEFIVGEAIGQGADTLVGTGLLQSNSARLTAAAAARLGLRCELGLRALSAADTDAYRQGGNVLLDDLFGATVHALAFNADSRAFAAERLAALAQEGRIGYAMPPGASSPVGSLGYVVCALEIATQERELGFQFDRIVVANGSAGTQAGLVAGFALLGRHGLVHGFSVLNDEAGARASTLDMARSALMLLEAMNAIEPADVKVSDLFLGPGYGHVTPQAIAAIRLLAAHEGLLLDPVYSGKAFAGLLAQARAGDLGGRQNVLFLMTGGAYALSAYRETFGTL